MNIKNRLQQIERKKAAPELKPLILGLGSSTLQELRETAKYCDENNSDNGMVVCKPYFIGAPCEEAKAILSKYEGGRYGE